MKKKTPESKKEDTFKKKHILETSIPSD